jgi:hypothetical protein
VDAGGKNAELALVLTENRILVWPNPQGGDGASALTFLKSLTRQQEPVHRFSRPDMAPLFSTTTPPGQVHVFSIANTYTDALPSLEVAPPSQPPWLATRMSLRLDKEGVKARGMVLLDEATKTRLADAFSKASPPPGHCHVRKDAILSWETPWDLGRIENLKRVFDLDKDGPGRDLHRILSGIPTALPEAFADPDNLAGLGLLTLRPLDDSRARPRGKDPLRWINLVFFSAPAGPEGKKNLTASLAAVEKQGQVRRRNIHGRLVHKIGATPEQNLDYSVVVDDGLFSLGLGDGADLASMLARIKSRACPPRDKSGLRFHLDGPAFEAYLEALTKFPTPSPKEARNHAAGLQRAQDFLRPFESISFEMLPTHLGLRYQGKIVLRGNRP